MREGRASVELYNIVFGEFVCFCFRSRVLFQQAGIWIPSSIIYLKLDFGQVTKFPELRSPIYRIKIMIPPCCVQWEIKWATLVPMKCLSLFTYGFYPLASTFIRNNCQERGSLRSHSYHFPAGRVRKSGGLQPWVMDTSNLISIKKEPLRPWSLSCSIQKGLIPSNTHLASGV